MKKTIIKDGKAERVNEFVADRKVREEGYKFCPKHVYKDQTRKEPKK